MRAERDAVAVAQRTAWSEAVCEHVIALPAYQSAAVVHCFLSIQSELDTRPLITHALAHGKRVAIPLWMRHSTETPACEITSLADEDYKIAGFGLPVPRVQRLVAPEAIDLVLVPLLAFAPLDPTQGAEHGWLRLGYGAGFYDLFLARVRALKLGIAFEMARVAHLPREPHDVLLDGVVTETGLHMP